MSEPQAEPSKVIAAVVCDLERSPIGTVSRLERSLAGTPVLTRTLARVRAVKGIDEIVVMAPAEQMERVGRVAGQAVRVVPLERRGDRLDARVRAGRAWNLAGWRGGAGQWTVFDEDYHPKAVAEAAKATGGGHVLCVAGHAAFLDVEITSALVQHHLHKNHEMRLTYTPASPGISGVVLRGDMVQEMAEKGVLPGQLLGYDPLSPTFDTLIREACMQVDPALSKIPNRFLLDTDRDWAVAEKLAGTQFDCAASLALAAADLRGQGLGYGVRGNSIFSQPRELEIELTGRRMTAPPGCVPAEIRENRGELDASQWCAWLSRQRLSDDLLVTFCGDGDPANYASLPQVLAATRAAGGRNICVQTDLAGDIAGVASAIEAANVDVLSVQFYGDDAATYSKVAGADLYGAVIKNLERLLPVINERGMPLVVPRLLKVRETIPQLEAFFDRWVMNAAWAVIDGPTDRAGAVAFGAVVDMGPPKRKPCRRIAERMIVRANGSAGACDQDVLGKLQLGHIESATLEQMWNGAAMTQLRQMHACGKWAETDPCAGCREWHRA